MSCDRRKVITLQKVAISVPLVFIKCDTMCHARETHLVGRGGGFHECHSCAYSRSDTNGKVLCRGLEFWDFGITI